MENTDYTSNLTLFANEDKGTGKIRREYEVHQELFRIQPEPVRRFLEAQARSLSEMVLMKNKQVHFTLPEQVVVKPGQEPGLLTPTDLREQSIGGFLDRITRGDIRVELRQRLSELEQSQNPAIAVSAMLIRHATAMHIVHTLLPDGHTVRYAAMEDDELPSKHEEGFPKSTVPGNGKVNTVAHEESKEGSVDELQVPFMPEARKFYFPQWVAFGNEGELLVNTIAEAEAYLSSMQRYMMMLHAAIGLAPYMVIDNVYQQKRYGMLGQLVNQGRAFARYQTAEIIKRIQIKAKAGGLNRGLSLDLPYFDDQELVEKIYSFVVIPTGLIMFVPAFIVRAAQMESAKIAQDTRLSSSTRKHLLGELRLLGQMFDKYQKPKERSL